MGIRRNGKAYDTGDVILTLFNQEEDEVKDIEYGVEQEHMENHSLKNEPTSYSMGKITRQGNARLVLYMNAASKLEKASGGNLLSIKPFDANVTFVNEDNDLVNDTVTWKFASQGRKITGGDGAIYMEYKMFVLDIKFNNA